MSIHIMTALFQALGDSFDPEYCESGSGSLTAIHWDPVSQVLSFQGQTHCIDVWFGRDDNGDSDVVVEFNLTPGGMDPQVLWKAP